MSNPRQIGLKNQRKSLMYVLDNFEKYGIEKDIRKSEKNGRIISYTDRIISAGASYATTDFFGLWDLIVLPSTSIYPIHFIQVKTNGIPDASYLVKLMEFPVPDNIVKELHIWYYNLKLPKIITLNGTNDIENGL